MEFNDVSTIDISLSITKSISNDTTIAQWVHQIHVNSINGDFQVRSTRIVSSHWNFRRIAQRVPLIIMYDST